MRLPKLPNGKEWKSATAEEAKVEHKGLESAFEIKDEATGEIEAIIATFGVIDRDGDIVQKGSIPEGSVVAISEYGHSAVFGEAPVGKGVVVIDGNKAIVKGQLFMDMPEAKKTLSVLKGMGKDQQWSWGFRVLGSEVPSEDQRKQGAYRIITKTETFEASPVLRGAGIGTRTLSAKSEAPAEEPPTPAPAPAPAAAAPAGPLFDPRVERVMKTLKR